MLRFDALGVERHPVARSNKVEVGWLRRFHGMRDSCFIHTSEENREKLFTYCRKSSGQEAAVRRFKINPD